MTRRLPVLLCSTLIAALLPACGTGEEPAPDAGRSDAAITRDAGELLPEDAGSEPADAGEEQPADAGEALDAGGEEPDAGGIDAGIEDAGSEEPDAGSHPVDGGNAADAGTTADAGEPELLERCGAASLSPGRTMTVTLDGQVIDFSGGYSWGEYSPPTALYWGYSAFTWTSTDAQYVLELVVHEGFSGVCPATFSLPSQEVVWNLYSSDDWPPEVDVFSSGDGSTGSLKLDAYDLFAGGCSVSAACTNCRFSGDGHVVVIDGQVVESCQ